MKKAERDQFNAKRDASVAWFSENLPYIRALTGLTLENIASDTGISKQTLSLIENPDKDKKLSYYQYIVIRNYIENSIIYKIKYLSKKPDDYADAIPQVTAYISISVCMNDMAYFGESERKQVIAYWEAFKAYVDSRTDTPTAKTFYNAMVNEIDEDLDNLSAWFDTASDEEIYNKMYDAIIEPLIKFVTNMNLTNAGLKLLDELGIKAEYKLVLYSIVICFFGLLFTRPAQIKKEIQYVVKYTISNQKELFNTLEKTKEIRANFSDESLERLSSYINNTPAEADSEKNSLQHISSLALKTIKYGLLAIKEQLDWEFAWSYDGMKAMNLKDWKSYNSFLDFLASKIESHDVAMWVEDMGLSEEEIDKIGVIE